MTRMLAELVFFFGVVWAVWYIDFCNPRAQSRRGILKPCKTNPPPQPAVPYTPLPYPKDSHNSDVRNRTYDVDGVRVM